MLIEYVPKKFSSKTLRVIADANDIIYDYRDQGLSLTLRQLYYRFVATGLLPNKQSEYKRMGSIISDARLAGEIDWDAIEDRGRNLQTIPSWNGPDDIIRQVARSYAIDVWEDQPYRVEVWVEKEALIGVVGAAAEDWDCPSFACKGYTSQSEMWRAGRRFKKMVGKGQTPVVIHLGDMDPSGVDMTRDIQDRLSLFSGVGVEVRRIALNEDQIKVHEPPPNPVKLTDSRASKYTANYGNDSWELDALEPAVLRDLIHGEIADLVNMPLLDKQRERQEHDRELLKSLARDWTRVAKSLEL